VENIDWNVGRVLAKLKDLKLDNDTIVVYFSDNGPNSWRWNGGMKGRKGQVDEGGVRSPLFVRWPSQIGRGRKIARIAGAIDLLPTLTELAGVPLKSTKPLDGKSLAPLLRGEGDASNWPDRMIFSLWNKRVSVRTQQYRLDADGHLFDMLKDPGQSADVAAANPAMVTRLQQAVEEWTREMLPVTGKDTRPYPVGHTPLTYLPARDGESTGGIQRSNRAPNSSYFTHWKSTDGRITWDIEVAQAGEYEAVMHHTTSHPGSTIELSFGVARIETTLRDKHDPPLYGMKEDRTDRGTESYAKDFRPLRLGVIKLEKSRGLLTLRAVKLAGGPVADVRHLILTRR